MKRHIIALITLLFTTTVTLSAQICTAIAQGVNNTPVTLGSPASTTANINAVGDLVAITAWCFPGCTPVSVTMGAQTAVQTTVSGNPDPGSPGTPGSGQPFLFYVLSAAASGSQTLTFTASNFTAGGAPQTQVAYQDFKASAGCVFRHDVDSPLGTGLGGTSNTPFIIPTAGDVLFAFTAISEHINSVNSPWSCTPYPPNLWCGILENTINGVGYILSASSGSTANNMTNIHSSDNWQALITSFSIVPNGPAPKPPTNLRATLQ